ncbi:esterase/lipase family protein [Pseudomonas sp. H3_C08]
MTTYRIASQAKAAKVGAALLKLSGLSGADFETATSDDFLPQKVALFIHGFTADASYMRPLMEEFVKNGYSAIAFNYPCYNGIDYAASSLFQLLAEFDALTNSRISNNRIVVVAHSMGGLVARALVGPEGGHKYVRKVFTLGSPHAGTLQDSRMIQWLVAQYESISGLVHGGFSMSSRSALQLMKADGPTPFLSKLQLTPIPAHTVEFHSFSGGKNYLTFNGGLLERVLNIVIQRQLNNPENDGLVLETSTDLSNPQLASCVGECTHHNSYADHKILNHSHLCESQILNLKILSLAD